MVTNPEAQLLSSTVKQVIYRFTCASARPERCDRFLGSARLPWPRKRTMADGLHPGS